MGNVLLNIASFLVQKAGYRIAKPWVRNPMGAIGRLGQIASHNFVASLSAGFYAFQTPGDGIVDGLVVADFEVQKPVIFDASPVTTKQRIAANEVKRAGDVSPVAFGHDQQSIFCHGSA